MPDLRRREQERLMNPMITPDDIDFLTHQINVNAKALGIQDEVSHFGFLLKDEGGQVYAGCNGSLVYGSIYTDQLWVHPNRRGEGLGRQLMEQVHALGREKGCTLATLTTLSFQGARSFYENLGYVCDFERSGYVGGSSCLFFKKVL
jgi:GNAT superfamily N-acetyltransferase